VVKTKKEYLAWPGKRFGRPGADFSLYPVVNVGFVWMELKLGALDLAQSCTHTN
jgi:hypothetical protein